MQKSLIENFIFCTVLYSCYQLVYKKEFLIKLFSCLSTSRVFLYIFEKIFNTNVWVAPYKIQAFPPNFLVRKVLVNGQIPQIFRWKLSICLNWPHQERRCKSLYFKWCRSYVFCVVRKGCHRLGIYKSRDVFNTLSNIEAWAFCESS